MCSKEVNGKIQNWICKSNEKDSKERGDIFQNRELKHLETEKGDREPHEEHTKAGISEPTAQLGRNQDANEGIE